MKWPTAKCERIYFDLGGRMSVSLDTVDNTIYLGMMQKFAPNIDSFETICSTKYTLNSDGFVLPERFPSHEMLILMERTTSDSIVVESYNIGNNRPRAMWISVLFKNREHGDSIIIDETVSFLSNSHSCPIGDPYTIVNKDAVITTEKIEGEWYVDKITLSLWKRYVKAGIEIPISIIGNQFQTVAPIILIDKPKSKEPNKILIWWDEKSLMNLLKFKWMSNGLYLIDYKGVPYPKPLKILQVDE